MSTLTHAIKGASWMGALKFVTQVISWSGTVVVTRLLTSEDYGVMELATVFTGYITFFVEFGLGTSLVNKKELLEEERSSSFWVLMVWGIILSSLCLVLAPFTANYFNEPRVLHLTQAAGLLFILSSIGIVPRALIQRDLRFKELGIIELVTTMSSVIFSVVFAYSGMGPWTLIGSYIFREILNVGMYFYFSAFRPKLFFNLAYVLPHLKFGFPVVISSSLFYIYTKADRFFGGASLGAEILGYYAVALQLAAIPVEKVVTLLQGVLYPTLSKVKDDLYEFQKTYLCFISLVALVTFPIYVCGFILADEIIPFVIGEKWRPSLPCFKLLLVGQLIMALSSPNSLIHFGRGKPVWNMIYNLCLTPVVVLSFYYSASLRSLDLLALPWVYVYPLFSIAYIGLTNREIKISFVRYFSSLKHPCFATLILAFFVFIAKPFMVEISLFRLISLIMLSLIVYFLYFITLGRGYLEGLKGIFRGNYIKSELF